MKDVYEHLLRDIAEEKIRPRPGRRNLRCVKRRLSRYPAAPKRGTRALPKFVRIRIIK